MIRRPRLARSAALALVSLSLSGCAGLGTMGDVLGGLSGTQLSGEVRRVDTRRQRIQVSTGYGGTETVEFDRDTRVVYRQERYSVGALEAGDEVSMQVQRDRRGTLYTDYIRVDRSVRERQGGRYPRPSRLPGGDRSSRDRDRAEARVQSFQGRVGRIDHRRGWFELREERRGVYTVTLPSRPESATSQRFQRLRSGDRVRLQGRLLDRGRVELRRFR